MALKVKPVINKLKSKVKKFKKKILRLWEQNNKFRYGAIAAGVFLAGISIGATTMPSYNSEFEVVPSPNAEGRVTETSTPGVIGSETNIGGVDVNPDNLLDFSNRERKRAERTQLKLNSKLASSAQAKCEDMVNKNYWDHNSPDGLTPWYFIDNSGYIYGIAGENLAYGFSTAGGVVIGWMNSPSHKENLLNKEFTEVGFGICDSENYQGGPNTIVVQHLGMPLTDTQQVEQPQQQYIPEPYRAPVCKKTPIPYETIYEEVAWLDPGETESFSEGRDGYIEKCTADSTGYKPPDFKIEPYDKTIYIGVTPTPEEGEPIEP